MKSVGCLSANLALVLLVLAVFDRSLLWIGVPLLGLALLGLALPALLYRPPELHLGVIYRLGRFGRWVGPDEWTLVLPWLEQIRPPISLHLRRIEIKLSDLLAQDRVPIDCELIVYYQLDLRLADPHFWPQALLIPAEGWNSIVRTVLREAAAEVAGGLHSQQLLRPASRGLFKQRLSALLAERVLNLGMVVNPRTGVSVQALKPAEAIWQAMLDRLAAASLGEAALARVRPMLEALSQSHPDVAWEVLLLEWAAAVAQTGNSPQAIIAQPDSLGQGGRAQDAFRTARRVVVQAEGTPDTGLQHRRVGQCH